MKRKAFKAALPYTLPVFLGYLFLGIAFGVLLASAGYPFYLAPLMSIFIYAGSMQFVAIDLLTGGAGILTSFIMTFTVNARHLFYGLSMLEKFKNMEKKKFYMIFSLTDETYSLLCSLDVPAQIDRNWFYFFIAILDQSYWILGATIGAIAGTLINFDSTGIDFAMTALFIVIFVEQWESTKNHLPALVGLAVSLICLLIFGADNFIIAAMIGILILLSVGKPYIEKRDLALSKNAAKESEDNTNDYQ